jgi:hypothetical protein
MAALRGDISFRYLKQFFLVWFWNIVKTFETIAKKLYFFNTEIFIYTWIKLYHFNQLPWKSPVNTYLNRYRIHSGNQSHTDIYKNQLCLHISDYLPCHMGCWERYTHQHQHHTYCQANQTYRHTQSQDYNYWPRGHNHKYCYNYLPSETDHSLKWYNFIQV